MHTISRYSRILTTTTCCVLLFASAAHSRPILGNPIKPVTRAVGKVLSKFKKKQDIHESQSEVMVDVQPGKNYSITLKKGQRLALVLDANDGRIWNIESRPNEIADEYPEGKANVTYTTIFFTPKPVDGEGDIVLKTKILENYPEDWSNAETCVIHITVRNAP